MMAQTQKVFQNLRHPGNVEAVAGCFGAVTLTQETRHEIQRSRENEAHEWQNLALRLENELLKFERRLPPAKSE